jgi:zinc D-Ala-D-Ala carboxypeptidase
MQLSKNLALAEVMRSETAKRKGISNMPTPEHIENFKLLAEKVFQPIREHFATPIHISSGYRSAALNKAIGGAGKTVNGVYIPSSQHCTGEAIDIDMDGTAITNAEIFNYIKDNLSFDQLIWEFGTDSNPDWVHVSYESTGKQRKQILKAVKSAKGTSYLPYK